MSLGLLLNRYEYLLVIIVSIFILGLTYFATVETKNGDFTHSLLVSQALIEHQTVQLDDYQDKVDRNRNFDYDYRIEKINGSYYYLFPLAPSVLSVPIVWVANLLGQEMFIHEQEYVLLKFMAVVSCVVIFNIIYLICRCYLDILPSLTITLISMLGTNLISSLGTALSSMNFAVLFVVLTLLLIALYNTSRIKTINPYLAGLLLFFAFWSRPTTAPFILFIMTYIFFRHRAIFIKLVITALIPFLVFIGWSWFTYGHLLPTFYLPSRLVATPAFWTAFYGNAFSPARGLFVFSPFFLLVVVGTVWSFRDLKKEPLFWLTLVWFILHYIAIARKNEDWWDGHNYGPRVLTDVMPALILLSVLLWRTIAQRASLATRTVALSSYLVFGVAAIFIHSYQGLYNPSTYQWNKNPNIDRYPEYLFNWKYPQFWVTEESLRRRSLEHQQKRLSNYSLGNTLTHNSRDAVFWNWYEPEESWRWTQGASPRIVFKLGNGILEPGQQYVLEILGASIKAQQIGVALNETALGKLNFTAFDGAMPETQTLTFDGALLKENKLNTVDFYISMDQIGQGEETETAGMAFVSMKLYPSTKALEGVHYFDSEFFETGFSSVEKGWRWTDGTLSTMLYPQGAVDVNSDYALEITSGALGVQYVEIILNNVNIGALTFDDFEPETHTLIFSGALLNENDNNRINFLIPGAIIPEGDSRQLGLAFVSLNIYPVNRQ